MVTARTVVLATGLKDDLPPLAGIQSIPPAEHGRRSLAVLCGRGYSRGRAMACRNANSYGRNASRRIRSRTGGRGESECCLRSGGNGDSMLCRVTTGSAIRRCGNTIGRAICFPRTDFRFTRGALQDLCRSARDSAQRGDIASMPARFSDARGRRVSTRPSARTSTIILLSGRRPRATKTWFTAWIQRGQIQPDVFRFSRAHQFLDSDFARSARPAGCRTRGSLRCYNQSAYSSR